MTYVNMVKPELAQRYTASGLWTNKTFFEFIDERRRGASPNARCSPMPGAASATAR